MKIPGTLPYVAPELFKEGADKLSTASDIWAIGCIGYELFTGTRLFESEASVENFVRNSFVDPQHLAALQAFPKILEVLHNCLQPDPRRRWSVWRLLEKLGQSDNLFP